MGHPQRTTTRNGANVPKKDEDDREHRRKLAAAWTEFHEKHGRFADDWNGDFMPEDSTR